MDQKLTTHDKMDKLMIDTIDGDILIVVGVKDLSMSHNGFELWECIVHEYSPESKEYSKYHSVWDDRFFDDLIEATPTTIKLYGPSELLDCPLSDLEDKLRSLDFNDDHALSMHIVGSEEL